MQRWVPAPDIPDVALEVLHVDGIESHNRREETHVGFRHLVAEVEGPGVLGQVLLGTVQRLEQGLDVALVSFLSPTRCYSAASLTSSIEGLTLRSRICRPLRVSVYGWIHDERSSTYHC